MDVFQKNLFNEKVRYLGKIITKQRQSVNVLDIETCGDSLRVERSLFQAKDNGSIPISPLHLILKEIDNNLARYCYKKWHYLKAQKFISTINFGVFTNGNLWGCISYGAPNAKVLKGYWTPSTQEGWFEIKRFAVSDFLPKNSESRIIAISIKLLKKIFSIKGIVTYADNDYGHIGTIYKASGFKYLGLTGKKSDFYLENSDTPIQRGKIKHLKGQWKPRSQKHLFMKQEKSSV